MAPAATVELRLAEPGDCSICADRLREGLANHRGVVAVEAVRGRDSVSVSYDPDLCSLDCLDEAARDLRLDLESAYAHELWKVEGMDCADCAQTIERAVARVDGVTSVAVSFPAETMRIEYRPSRVDLGRIRRLVGRLGYRIVGAEAVDEGAAPRWPSRELTTAVSTVFLLAALIVDFLTGLTPIPLYLASVVAGGAALARSGIVALIATRRPDINLLMAIAALGATAIGAWLEAALVVVLFSLGELLEGRAVARARRELAELVALTPERARVRRRQEGSSPLAVLEELEILVEEVVVGDLVVVRPGERIPVDGIVREGSSSVDQAPITGESTPVDKAPGDDVFAGTLNAQGLLLVEAAVPPGATTLDRIGKLVAEAQARKSPSERWVDSFARWYTPLVVGVAAVVAVVPPLVGTAFSDSFYSALALLIIACPCALVISTPVSIVSALARASAAGVLVKGGAHLEQAALTTSVAFDKTGTLTHGRPEVAAIEPADGVGADELLALAASLERGSEHPLARAIVAGAEEEGLTLRPVAEFHALAGLGATGRIDGSLVAIGDPRLLEQPLDDVTAAELERLRAAGRTAVVVARDGLVLGAIGLADTLRDEGAEAVADLRTLGVEPIVLLTGDNAATAAAVASSVGIEDVRAGLLPHDKVAAVAELGPGSAMVGDGVNDAPALAAAGVGIAMGSAGSDTAIEVADVAILGDDPRKVAGLVGLARWTRAVVRQNIAFSLATKAIAVALLAASLLPLWGAVVADVGASLVVIGNGLRLVRGRPLGRAAQPLLPPRRL
jgi:Cd2+/Zn2+-exporting ATPase